MVEITESGTALFVSASPSIDDEEQLQALREAFEIAANPLPVGEPLDWMNTTCPSKWLLNNKIVDFDWYDEQELFRSVDDNCWWNFRS